MIDEALHEKKIANIADKIAKDRKVKNGINCWTFIIRKTTFAQRLGIQLRVNKIKPVTISVDNYSALHTLNTWHKVTEGEEKNIFPFQESANTILIQCHYYKKLHLNIRNMRKHKD